MFKYCACIAFLSIANFGGSSASAEVNKIMRTGDGHLQAEFVLDFKPPSGWQEDRAATSKYGLRIYVPTGSDFGNAPALMYIRVSFNSDHRAPETFIRVAHERWRASARDVEIKLAPRELRSNGRDDFEVYRFYNPGEASANP